MRTYRYIETVISGLCLLLLLLMLVLIMAVWSMLYILNYSNTYPDCWAVFRYPYIEPFIIKKKNTLNGKRIRYRQAIDNTGSNKASFFENEGIHPIFRNLWDRFPANRLPR